MSLRARLAAGRGHGLVDAHFDRAAEVVADDRRMWRHLRRCGSCRARYRARSLLEFVASGGVAEASEQARRRLGRAIFAPLPRRARPLWPALGLALVGGLGALALVAWPRSEFRARGPGAVIASESPTVLVFRFPGQGHPGETRAGAAGVAERVGSVVRVGDGLAFSYVNPPAVGATHLMVFGVDAGGRVYWFWPEWRSAAANPLALAIPSGPAPVELPEGVRHQLPAGPLTLRALFARRPYGVREVEAAVAAGEAALAALDGTWWREQVEVVP